MKYAQVVLDYISDALDRPFQYRIPEHLRGRVVEGSKVQVPFRSREIPAYVVSLEEEAVVDQVKDISGLDEPSPLVSKELLWLSCRVSRQYYCRWIEAIKLCLPPAGKRVKPGYREYVRAAREKGVLEQEISRLKKTAFRQAFVLECLLLAEEEGLCWKALQDKTGATRQVLHALSKRGLVETIRVPCERNSWREAWEGLEDEREITLSEQQESAWQQIKSGFCGPEKEFLLHGITGSGKTELYLRAAEEALSRGRDVLILVPEIMLTPQMIDQCRGRFWDNFALLHSGLSPAERFDQWWKVKNGKAKVVLGARSAVFAPLANLGLIVVDEEHENTYKQDDAPRYHARDIAKWRREFHDAVLVMGSATPSLETYFDSREGRIKRVLLAERYGGRSLPRIEVVDMRREFRQKHRSVFSRLLLGEMQKTVWKGEQAILFLNRRGFASFQLCRKCGFVVKCPQCDVSLTLHHSPEHLRCHYCNYMSRIVTECPQCGSPYIKSFGLGTQRLEEEVRKHFPGAGVIRMDSDASSGKEAHLKAWKSFREGTVPFLIGTQMVAKGLDFPGVTLVGVVTADITLHLPDFRSGERTFQLLSQVAGRAGRGSKKGRVIIQTYTPWHYSIKAASTHGFEEFVNEELERRRELFYPPFSELILFGCSAPQEKKAREHAEALKKRIIAKAPALNGEAGEVLGPSPAPVQKVKGHFRFHLLCKGKDLGFFSEALREAVWSFREEVGRELRVIVDFNPFGML